MNTDEVNPCCHTFEVWKDERTHGWTWKQIVNHALAHNGGAAGLPRLYEIVSLHPRTKMSVHWQAKVRQVLQADPKSFVRESASTWGRVDRYHPEEVAEFERLRRERWPLLGPRKKATE